MALYPDGGTPPAITEDSPGWDCQTMGNRVCGTEQPSSWLPTTGSDTPETALAGASAILIGVLLVVATATLRWRTRPSVSSRESGETAAVVRRLQAEAREKQ